MKRLVAKLEEQFAEGARLEKAIRKNLGGSAMGASKKSPKAPMVQAKSAPARRSRGCSRGEGASFQLPPSASEMPDDYVVVLAELKQRIAAAQTRAALAVSRELVALYWHVGGTIVLRQASAGWGDAVVERLSHDLRQAFPALEGFSPRNIWRMRSFFLAWSGDPKKLTRAVSETGTRLAAKKLPQAVSEIPWGHNIVLLQRLETSEERLWYAEQTRARGWSRAVLKSRSRRRFTPGRERPPRTSLVRCLRRSPSSPSRRSRIPTPSTF